MAVIDVQSEAFYTQIVRAKNKKINELDPIAHFVWWKRERATAIFVFLNERIQYIGAWKIQGFGRERGTGKRRDTMRSYIYQSARSRRDVIRHRCLNTVKHSKINFTSPPLFWLHTQNERRKREQKSDVMKDVCFNTAKIFFPFFSTTRAREKNRKGKKEKIILAK